MTENVLKLFTKNDRVCKICKVTKPLSEFFKGKDYVSHKCEPCFRKLERERQNNLWKNDPKYRERHNTMGQEHRKKTGWKDKRTGLKFRPDKLKRLYGVTYEQIVETLNKQFGRCGNIGCCTEISLEVKGTFKGRAVIDHSHETGEFRALLCLECNRMLADIENKANKLLGLLDYLNKYRK